MTAPEQKLPVWPVCDAENCDDLDAFMRYERARAEAAIERLRVAVEALERYAAYYKADGPIMLVGKAANDALLAIGDIPSN